MPASSGPAWTPEEEQLLLQLLEEEPLSSCSQLAMRIWQRTGVPRTANAVHKKVWRMGLNPTRGRHSPRTPGMHKRGLILLKDLARELGIPYFRVDHFCHSGMPYDRLRAVDRNCRYIRPEDVWPWLERNWHRLHGADPRGIERVFGIPVEQQKPLPQRSPSAAPVRRLDTGDEYPSVAQMCREMGWSLDNVRRRLRDGKGRTTIGKCTIEKVNAG